MEEQTDHFCERRNKFPNLTFFILMALLLQLEDSMVVFLPILARSSNGRQYSWSKNFQLKIGTCSVCNVQNSNFRVAPAFESSGMYY